MIPTGVNLCVAVPNSCPRSDAAPEVWARPDDVKTRRQGTDAPCQHTRMQSRPSGHQSTRHASSLGCARPARRRPFRLCVSASSRSDAKRVAAASVRRHAPRSIDYLVRDPRPPAFKGPPSPTRVFSMRWRSRPSPSQIVVRCLGGPMHSSARCPKGVEVRAVHGGWVGDGGGHWALGTRALFDGGMVVPGRPLSQCLGQPRAGGGCLGPCRFRHPLH